MAHAPAELFDVQAGDYTLPMRSAPPRVAYFPDTFYEVNGVAHTSRHFEAFARRRGLPFFCLRPGKRDTRRHHGTELELTTLDIPRGRVFAVRLENDLSFDPVFLRHKALIARHLRQFRPDIIHITGPSEPGILGAWLAANLGVPLVASWHTNLHEYAARRSQWALRLLPRAHASNASGQIERLTLAACARFYRLARILFAPNDDLCKLLEGATGRRCYRMARGVDTHTFSPQHRDRPASDDAFVLGFCGRLSIEKNVALLVRIDRELRAQGITNFRMLIVGHGREEPWLRQQLPAAVFAGVLRGEPLALAYANMDLFVFPSHTDTFGNVVLEALASGVPAIVTPDGGPRTIVRDSETGFITGDDGFTGAVAALYSDRERHARMCEAARAYAQCASWDAVFESVYSAYETVLPC